jgi:hypothetical protein
MVEKRRPRGVDTTRVHRHERAHQRAGELARNGVRSVEERTQRIRGRREVRRHEREGRRAGELARRAVQEVGDLGMRCNERRMRPAKTRSGQGARCEGASSLAKTRWRQEKPPPAPPPDSLRHGLTSRQVTCRDNLDDHSRLYIPYAAKLLFQVC